MPCIFNETIKKANSLGTFGCSLFDFVRVGVPKRNDKGWVYFRICAGGNPDGDG